MELLYRNEHEQCFHFDHSEKPVIELVRIAKERSDEIQIRSNEVVFFMEGRLRFTFHNLPGCESMKGQILFLPAGVRFSYLASAPTMLIIFRILEPIRLCDNFTIEKLYDTEHKNENGDSYRPKTHSFSILPINTRMWYFLDGIIDCYNDGIRCKSYSELKIKEFFLLLRLYYPREAIYDFLYMVLSGDMAFSEYVRQRWQRFRNVEEIAGAMHMTSRQFSFKFKNIFGVTPYKWMKEGRSKIIRQQLLTTNKPIKQIALENGFCNISQFTTFCKKELGNTPLEIRKTRGG